MNMPDLQTVMRVARTVGIVGGWLVTLIALVWSLGSNMSVADSERTRALELGQENRSRIEKVDKRVDEMRGMVVQVRNDVAWIKQYLNGGDDS